MGAEDPDAALRRLAGACGIDTTFTDIWGDTHDVSPDTLRALLAAMGHDPGVSGSGERLRQLERERWRRTLPPAVVLEEGGPAVVPVTVDERDAGRRLRWRLQAENGETCAGDILPAECGIDQRGEGEGRGRMRVRLALPASLAPGYHELAVEGADGEDQATTGIITTPRSCHLPPVFEDEGRTWGVASQLYAARSGRNWGMGDFGDVAAMTGTLASEGADVLGLNPLHALFPGNPAHASPYSPSSRQFLNPLYIDVEAVPEMAHCTPAQEIVSSAAFQARLLGLRERDEVDYAGVAEAKHTVLGMLYDCFRERELAHGSERAGAFREFQAVRGRALRRHALFEALQERLHAADAAVWGAPAWPQPYRDPAGPAVEAFEREALERVEYFEYLQWLADGQLADAAARARGAGMHLGLYLDLAVGVDRGGADAWSWPGLYAMQADTGAPPDDFNLRGQNWGLPPMVPRALEDHGFAPFVQTLRANMRHAGALRIDHVMGLMRLFWVPSGAAPAQGTYVRYPFRELMGILALESRRNHCVVVGEDLGTVPEEVRAALAPANVLSYRLLWFQRQDDGALAPPGRWPRQALVGVSTHDLPTLAGFWSGTDLEERERLGLFPSAEAHDAQVVGRAEDRARLLLALQREALLPEGVSMDPASCPTMTPELARAVHEYVARAPSQMLMVQLEDVWLEPVQVNLPGTTDERPNWRLRTAQAVESLLGSEDFRELAAMLRRERPSPRAGHGAREAPPAAVIPGCTYRLQLHRGFTLADALDAVDYLDALGVTHLYASPLLKARAGSTHGYDIVEHSAVNPELGTRAQLEALADALHRRGMHLLLDVVPNHMAVGGDDNAWWLDVLENGPASAHASYFDIDWQPVMEALRGRVLLPVLGDHYGDVLESGELRVVFDADSGSLGFRYHEHLFPADPRTYPFLLEMAPERLDALLPAEHPVRVEFDSLVTAFRNLPPRDVPDPERLPERRRDKDAHKQRLAVLAREHGEVRTFIEGNAAFLNGGDGVSPRAGLMHEWLEQQAFRVAYWRVAADEINYRRFFDINHLAGLGMEHAEVFEATHGLIGELVASGTVSGLRIDHPDGLRDPATYFERLQGLATGGEQAPGEETAAGDSNRQLSLYVVAEKILAGHEPLPADWQVHGTTGYDFLNQLTAVLLQPGGAPALDRFYRLFCGLREPLEEVLHRARRDIIRTALSSELTVLANRLNRISEADVHTRDYTLNALRDAIAEIVACFPVYRTYIDGRGVSEQDRRHVDWAVALARKRSVAADSTVFDFLRSVLLGDGIDERDFDYREQVHGFVARFQQYTAPVMAKGMEDTAFYRFVRLAALNEVGGEPGRDGISVNAFHRLCGERARRWPHAMLCTSTHDTKRGEDARARLAVIPEMAADWREHVTRWTRFNRSLIAGADGTRAPSANDEYLFYQALIGAWPMQMPDEAGLGELGSRLVQYMLKAVREAKVHTSWINPDEAYEAAVERFVKGALSRLDGSPFLSDFLSLQERLAWYGMLNSLTQTALKLTTPGVPDIYQGAELWDLSLVDPDNRRPVDLAARRACLERVRAVTAAGAGERRGALRALLDDPADGAVKMHLVHALLAFRRREVELFRDGEYLPLEATGRHASHVIAFARRNGRNWLVVIVPRWCTGLVSARELPLAGRWEDTAVVLPEGCPGALDNLLTGAAVTVPDDARALSLADALVDHPLGLLVPA